MLRGMAVQNGEKNNEFFAEGLANHLFEKIVGDRGSLINSFSYLVANRFLLRILFSRFYF